jgi:hypothetical protein
LNVSEPSVYGRQCGGNIPDRSASIIMIPCSVLDLIYII